MLKALESVKGLLKLDAVTIDNNIFRLHYKATVIILITLSVVVTSKQFIGDPIHCMGGGAVPEMVMNSFCWINSTFTLPERGGRLGQDVIQPGVAGHTDRDELKYHRYYQWVCFVLLFQAVLFYVPRSLWKRWEGGRIEMLVQELNKPEGAQEDHQKVVVDFFTTNMHQQNIYALRFFMCEILNFVNVVGQIYFMDMFLDGEFSTYGSDVVKFTMMEPGERSDPMSRVFPIVTKCTFHYFGASGSAQTLDGLCVLSLNIVNEKIYVFLWFWFGLLSISTGLMMLYRINVIVFTKMRMYLLRSRARLGPLEDIKTIAMKYEIGDWFLLYQLSRNVNPLVFNALISDLVKKLHGKEHV
ncbi:innexin inx2-like [Thrips palmi]|uniref:Innexin n=1 Tax=Thrips palmi TaxID=161013 RepID=A0A6P8Y409_THRPL|nr:innexin inx2-like [Thrips palmi]